MASGELETATPNSRSSAIKEIDLLNERYGGIKEMTEQPAALIVTDAIQDKNAIKEAKTYIFLSLSWLTLMSTPLALIMSSPWTTMRLKLPRSLSIILCKQLRKVKNRRNHEYYYWPN